jgi:hypothetical protein
MNRNSVKEYNSWLEEFGEIYKDYITSSQEIETIYGNALIKFDNIRRNNKNGKEEDIIRPLKELVYKFSVVYDANKSKNKTVEGPRNTNKFKQNIYQTEIDKLKEWLIAHINDPKFKNNFEKIVMFVAKKRQMIEFFKLTKEFNNFSKFNYSSDNNSSKIENYIYFEVFGKIRKDDLYSYLIASHANHLIKIGDRRQIIYKYKTKNFNLTEIIESIWKHTNYLLFPELFEIMNELYSKFLSLKNRDILVELYWLYMQTCPFERGSAAIGEILFSVLLRKHFGCDFFISKGWNRDPLTIPDIHALHYQLDEFKSIFWGQFTDCGLKKNSNNSRKK